MQQTILVLCDYIARTGFSTVSTNILRNLKKHYGKRYLFHVCAINYFGEPYWEDEQTYVFSGKRADVKQDDYGRYVFMKLLQDGNYDGMFIIQDLGVIVPIIEVLQGIKKKKKEEGKKQFKSMFYFPLDCHAIAPLVRNLEFFDCLVTYTEFARKEVLKFKPELKRKLKVVPHGNNFKDFYPIPKEEAAEFRKAYFGENADKFIITNLNRNQPRKDIPNTIFGFIDAKKMWDKTFPEPFLYLHMHPTDPMGWDIRGIMLQTDLVEGKDYQLISKEMEAEMADITTVNKIYNASDVYLTTTLGEGWGLGFSEAAACKLPVIAPYSTSFMEMSNYGENAFMLETIYPYCNFNDNVIRFQTDIYEVADKLYNVAAFKFGNEFDKMVLQKKVEDNYNWVSKLTWEKVCERWIEYFKETF